MGVRPPRGEATGPRAPCADGAPPRTPTQWQARVLGPGRGNGLDPHPRAVLAPALVLDDAVDQREQGPVAADADVGTRMDARADLTDQDVARLGVLPAVHLDAATLPLAVAPVAAAALSLLVRHGPWSSTGRQLIWVTLTVVMLCRCPRRRR